MRCCKALVAAHLLLAAPLLLWPSRVAAQVYGPLSLRPAVSEETIDKVTLEAPVIRSNDTVFTAEGGVRFTSGTKRADAEEITYDTATQTGHLLKARFTTCSEDHPHYYLSARSIVLGSGSTVSTRGVSLTLFGVKVITLPSLGFRIGGTGARSALPLPAYDGRDGFTVGHLFPLMNSSRGTAAADIRLTSRHGYQLDVNAQYGLNGVLSRPSGRLPRYDLLQNEVRAIAAKDGPLTSAADPKASRLNAFGSLSLRSRAFDLHDNNLVYFRRPEVGLHYLPRWTGFSRANVDPRLELAPEIVASWGRHAELPGPYGTVGRTGASLSLPVYAIKTSSTSALQPVLTYSWAHYGTGSTYQIYGLGVDYSRIYPGGSFLTLRYNQRRDSGVTPFEFDNLDIANLLEIGTQIRRGRHTYGFVGAVDAGGVSMEDWEVIYGYTLDCLAGMVSWNGRYNQLRLGISLVGL